MFIAHFRRRYTTASKQRFPKGATYDDATKTITASVAAVEGETVEVCAVVVSTMALKCTSKTFATTGDEDVTISA